MTVLLTTLPAAAAVIQGVALDQRTGYPAARASVTVRDWSSGQPGLAATVLTDRGGRFTVSALPAGAYLVTATRTAYGVTQYGQRRKNAPGTLVTLDKDASTFLELRLQRLAAISGTVLDENFLGLPDHPVHVYTARPPVRRVASGTSDDRGVFRIGKLEPGRYLVRSGSRDLEDGQATLPTFAPQTLAANEGKTVGVTFDDEVQEVNVQPFFGRLTSLEVTVAIPGGQAKVVVVSDSGRREATIGAFAPFVFDRLVPGWYEISSVVLPEETGDTSFDVVYVGGALQRHQARPTRRPNLEVRLEAAGQKRPDFQRNEVWARRKNLDGFDEPIRLTESMWRPAPGFWEVAVRPAAGFAFETLSRNWHPPRASRLGPSDDWEEIFVEAWDRNPVYVRLTGRAGALSGAVASPGGGAVAGAPVFLLPLDEDVRRKMNGSRLARTDARGLYRFESLVPGNYLVASSFDVEEVTRESLEQARAKVVAIEAGGRIQDLELSTAP